MEDQDCVITEGWELQGMGMLFNHLLLQPHFKDQETEVQELKWLPESS